MHENQVEIKQTTVVVTRPDTAGQGRPTCRLKIRGNNREQQGQVQSACFTREVSSVMGMSRTNEKTTSQNDQTLFNDKQTRQIIPLQIRCEPVIKLWDSRFGKVSSGMTNHIHLSTDDSDWVLIIEV